MKEFKGQILLILGIGLVTYNVFNFYYSDYQGGHYYYNTGTLWLLTIGAMLITLGVIKSKK